MKMNVQFKYVLRNQIRIVMQEIMVFAIFMFTGETMKKKQHIIPLNTDNVIFANVLAGSFSPLGVKVIVAPMFSSTPI